MKDALSLHRLLLEQQTAHEIVHLPRAITSADELPEVLGLPPDRCLCTRVYTDAAGRLAAVIVTAGTWPPESVVAEALDVASVVLAGADLVNEATQYAAELVGPLLLPEDLTVLVDENVAEADEVVYAATGEARTALGIRTLDLLALSPAKPMPLTRTPRQVRRNRPEQ